MLAHPSRGFDRLISTPEDVSGGSTPRKSPLGRTPAGRWRRWLPWQTTPSTAPDSYLDLLARQLSSLVEITHSSRNSPWLK